MMTDQALSEISFALPDGRQASLRDYLGKVVLLVNVASKCGLTPQYAGLEKIYSEQQEAGLVILGFPTGNFREQEFDTDQEIAQFCALNYGVSFPILSKISVAGGDQHPLYGALTSALTQPTGADEFRQMMKKHGMELAPEPELLWNFEKFLLDRQGRVVGRFAPHIGVEDSLLADAINQQLSAA
jgi:glutathione peroxidase